MAWSTASATTKAEVEAHLASLARADSVHVDRVEWLPGKHSGSASRCGGMVVIRLGEGILDDVEDARWAVAHEMGHVVLGHIASSRRRRAALVCAGAGGFLPALGAIGGVLLAGDVGASVGVLAGMGVWLLAVALFGRRVIRPQEIRADAYAAARGCPVTSHVAELYLARRAQRQWWDRGVERFRGTHPPWPARAAAGGPGVHETTSPRHGHPGRVSAGDNGCYRAEQ
jgi:hypothetical protein